MYLELTQSITDLLLSSPTLQQGALEAMRPHTDLYAAAEADKTYVLGQADLRRGNPIQVAVLRALLEQGVEWTLLPSPLGWHDPELAC